MKKTARFTRKLLKGIVIAAVIVVVVVIAGLAYNTYFSGNARINQVQIKVQYSGAWSGGYGGINGIQTWSGTGTRTVTLDISSSLRIVAANAQKQDGSTGTLTISMLKMDGTVLKTSMTNAPYGMASVSDNLGS